MTTLYYVRHGQTDWNLAELFQGQTDVPLNQTGRAQARETAQQLRGVPIDAILCSPLCRAVQTAHEICDVLELSLPIHTVEGLRERGFGSLEGAVVDRRWVDGLWDEASPINLEAQGGLEPMKQFCSRVNQCLDDILADYAHKTILIVAHGGVAIPLRIRMEGAPEEGGLNTLIPCNGRVLCYRIPSSAVSR